MILCMGNTKKTNFLCFRSSTKALSVPLCVIWCIICASQQPNHFDEWSRLLEATCADTRNFTGFFNDAYVSNRPSSKMIARREVICILKTFSALKGASNWTACWAAGILYGVTERREDRCPEDNNESSQLWILCISDVCTESTPLCGAK